MGEVTRQRSFKKPEAELAGYTTLNAHCFFCHMKRGLVVGFTFSFSPTMLVFSLSEQIFEKSIIHKISLKISYNSANCVSLEQYYER